MKFTHVLCKQHIGKMIRYLWQHQRDRKIPVSQAEQILKSRNITVHNAIDVVAKKKQTQAVQIKIFEEPVTISTERSNWKTEPCFAYEDNYLLQEGVPQALLLTKTLKLADELPENIQNLVTDIPKNIDNIVKRSVSTSVIFDAEQVKLPKLKDPERPAWNFPRVYGISVRRKVYNLSNKFLQLCESLNGVDIARCRSIIHDGLSSLCIKKDEDVIQFSVKLDIMMTSLMPLMRIADVDTQYELEMPCLHPLHHFIGLRKLQGYNDDDLFPIAKGSAFGNVHTIITLYDSEVVKNITELPVIETQIHGRSLIKAFTAAALCARQRFGQNVKELPEPVVVQCIQTNGQDFHFSVYQLNTLDIDGTEGVKNFWWSKPTIKLYDKGKYENGQPCLEEYNNEVFKLFHAFYSNK